MVKRVTFTVTNRRYIPIYFAESLGCHSLKSVRPDLHPYGSRIPLMSSVCALPCERTASPLSSVCALLLTRTPKRAISLNYSAVVVFWSWIWSKRRKKEMSSDCFDFLNWF